MRPDILASSVHTSGEIALRDIEEGIRRVAGGLAGYLFDTTLCLLDRAFDPIRIHVRAFDLRDFKGNSPYVAEFIASTAIFGRSNLSTLVLPGGEHRPQLRMLRARDKSAQCYVSSLAQRSHRHENT